MPSAALDLAKFGFGMPNATTRERKGKTRPPKMNNGSAPVWANMPTVHIAVIPILLTAIGMAVAIALIRNEQPS
jgi:hypothetical protein